MFEITKPKNIEAANHLFRNQELEGNQLLKHVNQNE